MFGLFCKDRFNRKNPYHILTEPQGPTCQAAHAWSSHGLRDSGLVLGLQKPSLKWSSFSSHHTCRCFVPFPHVTGHCKNITDHYLFPMLINTMPYKMTHLHIKTQPKDIFSLHSSRDIHWVSSATSTCCPNPSAPSICPRNKDTKITLEQVCILCYGGQRDFLRKMVTD